MSVTAMVQPVLCSSLCAGPDEPARAANGKTRLGTGTDIEYAGQFSYNPSPRKFRQLTPAEANSQLRATDSVGGDLQQLETVNLLRIATHNR